jgi:multicomponent Na+:H+ antiporter subunit F
MMTEGTGLLGYALWPVFGLLVRGPTLPDRVVGLDTVTTLMVAFAAVFSIESGEAAFLDIAIVLALVAFLTTVAFARYVERRGREVPGRGDAREEK